VRICDADGALAFYAAGSSESPRMSAAASAAATILLDATGGALG
jgi:hypothetical protein